MKTFQRLFHFCVLAGLLGAGSACVGSRAPASAKEGGDKQQEHVSQGEDNGVTLVIKADSIKDARILEVSIPILVTVKNMSGKAIRIDRSAFGLQSRGGGESVSMDPEEVAKTSYDDKPATFRKPSAATRAATPAGGVPGPGGAAGGPHGPTVVYSGPNDPTMPRDPKKDNKKKWDDLVVGRALTTQVLEYGKTAEGLVYFKPVTKGAEGLKQHLIVVANLNDPQTGQASAKFRIGILTEGNPEEEGGGGKKKGGKHAGGGGAPAGGGAPH